MKMAYINPQAVPDSLPSAIQVLQVVDSFGDMGVDVSLVTPTPSAGANPTLFLGRPLSSNVRLVHLFDWRKKWFFPFSSHRPFYQQAKAWVKKYKPDVVYLRNLKLAEVLLSLKDRPKIVFETHELFAQTYRENHPAPTKRQQQKLEILSARELKVYQSVDALVTITQALLTDIQTTYHIQTPSCVAPDGVDLALAKEAHTPTHAESEPVMLYIGSLHPWKGVDTLIAAMPSVKRGMLWIAGGMTEQIAALQAQADNLGVGARVRFLGKIPPAQRFKLIGKADICLLPLTDSSIASRYTSPLKLFEYMAMGKPIVVANHESIREVLVHGQDGVLVDRCEDPLCFAESINWLINDQDLQKKLGAAAAVKSAQFTWHKRNQRVLALLDSLNDLALI